MGKSYQRLTRWGGRVVKRGPGKRGMVFGAGALFVQSRGSTLNLRTIIVLWVHA